MVDKVRRKPLGAAADIFKGVVICDRSTPTICTKNDIFNHVISRSKKMAILYQDLVPG
jgi:hypothetical protein